MIWYLDLAGHNDGNAESVMEDVLEKLKVSLCFRSFERDRVTSLGDMHSVNVFL